MTKTFDDPLATWAPQAAALPAVAAGFPAMKTSDEPDTTGPPDAASPERAAGLSPTITPPPPDWTIPGAPGGEDWAKASGAGAARQTIIAPASAQSFVGGDIVRDSIRLRRASNRRAFGAVNPTNVNHRNPGNRATVVYFVNLGH